MYDPTVLPLAIACAIGLAIGAERSWRGFSGSLPFHVAPALFGAYLVVRQPGLTALFWFLPLQVLMWLVVAATVCMWSAERTPDAQGEFRGSGGLGLSWSLAFLLGVACAFSAWVLVATACATLLAFGLRTPRRVSATTVPAPAVTPAEAQKIVEEVSGNVAHTGVPGESEEEAAAALARASADGAGAEVERKTAA